MKNFVTFCPAEYIRQFELFKQMFILKTKLCTEYLRLANLSREYDSRLQYLNFEKMCNEAPLKVDLQIVIPKEIGIETLTTSDFFMKQLQKAGLTACTSAAGIIAPLVAHERGLSIERELLFLSRPLPVMLHQNVVGMNGFRITLDPMALPQRNNLRLFSLREVIHPEKAYVVQKMLQ